MIPAAVLEAPSPKESAELAAFDAASHGAAHHIGSGGAASARRLSCLFAKLIMANAIASVKES